MMVVIEATKSNNHYAINHFRVISKLRSIEKLTCTFCLSLTEVIWIFVTAKKFNTYKE